jgi:hypothetical protein
MCCDYIQRRYFCGICCIGAVGGFGVLIYGVSNLPSKLPDNQVNWGGQIISQPSGGSAQDLQDYIHNSYEYKLVTIGGIVMGCFILAMLICAWFGLTAPVITRQRLRRQAVVMVERPTIQVNNNDVEKRIRSSSSLSPQLTQAKHNRWKINEIV